MAACSSGTRPPGSHVRGKPAILNLLTCLTLAATGLVAMVVALVLVLPGLVPGFLRLPTRPVQLSLVTAAPSATPGLSFPTLPPEWTATPSPQPSPSATASDTPAASPVPSDTPTPNIEVTSATLAPVGTQTNVAQIIKLANVRSGPGTAYPIVASLSSAQTEPVIGRDSSGLWLAISFAGAPGGTGWVSTLVATYSGNINDLPVIQPAAPPPTAVPRTSTPVPVGPPTATSLPNVGGANGIQTLQFYMHQTTGTVYQDMFFTFEVKNTTTSPIAYGLLAAHTDQGVTASSYHGTLEPGQDLKWDDHINFPNTGTYLVYLGICYGTVKDCQGGAVGWTRLSNSVTVTIN